MFKLNSMSSSLLHLHMHNWPLLIPRCLHSKASLASFVSQMPIYLSTCVTSIANFAWYNPNAPFKHEGRSNTIQKAIQWHVSLKLGSNCFILCPWMLHQIECKIRESLILSFQIFRLCIHSVETHEFSIHSDFRVSYWGELSPLDHMERQPHQLKRTWNHGHGTSMQLLPLPHLTKIGYFENHAHTTKIAPKYYIYQINIRLSN